MWSSAGSAAGSSDEPFDLDDLLMEHAIQGLNHNVFWPLDLLQDLLTPRRITKAVRSGWSDQQGDKRLEDLVMEIRQRYLRVFAILQIVGGKHAGGILDFVDAKLDDEQLPLRMSYLESGGIILVKQRGYEDELQPPCFEGWRYLALESFHRWQWQVKPYFFDLEDGRVRHEILYEHTVLPWRALDGETETHTERQGGFGTVRIVDIDPKSHNFHDTLKKLRLPSQPFALKTIIRHFHNDIDLTADYFFQEVDFLNRFNGHNNPHFITLLAAFTQGTAHHFVLPIAASNLREYWEIHAAPLRNLDSVDLEEVRWLSEQILGITTALSIMHLENCRHGDIKPENILWHNMGPGSRGILVIADFGLVEKTGLGATVPTTMPGRLRGFTPSYRPPECDMEDRQPRSRGFDIWSLGCVYLEMACWMLEGFQAVEEFARARLLSTSLGTTANTFFEIQRTESTGPGSFRVKSAVQATISKLRHGANCTAYMHDLLDLIKDEMLVVRVSSYFSPSETMAEVSRLQSKPVVRIHSPGLVLKLKTMHQSTEDSAYVTSAAKPVLDVPRPPSRPEPDAVIAELNEDMATFLARAHATHATRSIFLREDPSMAYPHRTESTAPEASLTGDSEDAEQRDCHIFNQINETIRSDCLELKEARPLATFQVRWEMRECIETQLHGRTDLGPFLTITDNNSYACALSCHDYVAQTWEALGLGLLKALTDQLQGGSNASEYIIGFSETPVKSDSGPVKVDNATPAVLGFKGTVDEIVVLAKILAWVTATFRLPHETALMYSTVRFQGRGTKLEYSLSLDPLQTAKSSGPGTCWQPLFPRTVVACGFPVPSGPALRGLRMPLSMMLELAGIVYDVNLLDDSGKKRGVYYDGLAWKLYPRRYIQASNSIQWHLLKKPEEEAFNHQAAPPDVHERAKWYRDLGLEDVEKPGVIHVLGYCGDVAVQLGTESRKGLYESYLKSMTKRESNRTGLKLTAVAGTGSPAPGSSIRADVTPVYQAGLSGELTKIENLANSAILTRTAKDPVILFDVEKNKERAWMVPQLSLILDLYNFWAFGNAKRQVRYAKPGHDGGTQAKIALEDLGFNDDPTDDVQQAGDGAAEELRRAGDPAKDAKFMIPKIYGRLMHYIDKDTDRKAEDAGVVKLGQAPLLGWDWFDLVDDFSEVRPCRRDIRDQFRWYRLKKTPEWWPLTKKVPVFFGKGMGVVIAPASVENQAPKICRQWHPLPQGAGYLATTVSCLRTIASEDADKSHWKVTDVNRYWRLRESQGNGNFADCGACRDNNNTRLCDKFPQRLDRFSGWPWSTNNPMPSVPEKGAIVFARKRHDQPDDEAPVQLAPVPPAPVPPADNQDAAAAPPGAGGGNDEGAGVNGAPVALLAAANNAGEVAPASAAPQNLVGAEAAPPGDVGGQDAVRGEGAPLGDAPLGDAPLGVAGGQEVAGVEDVPLGGRGGQEKALPVVAEDTSVWHDLNIIYRKLLKNLVTAEGAFALVQGYWHFVVIAILAVLLLRKG